MCDLRLSRTLGIGDPISVVGNNYLLGVWLLQYNAIQNFIFLFKEGGVIYYSFLTYGPQNKKNKYIQHVKY